MAGITFLYASSLLPSVMQSPLRHIGLRKLLLPPKYMERSANAKSGRHHLGLKACVPHPRLVVLAVTEGSAESSSDEKIPSWAKPDSDEPPPWARDEGKVSASQPAFEVPFYAYLMASAITAIAAIGSIFEYINQKSVFGILNSDSVFMRHCLVSLLFLGYQHLSVQAANKEAEEQDRRDGYL